MAQLEAEGLLVRTTPHTVPLGRCQRCKTVVEPRLSRQWYVRTKPLAEPAIAAVEDGRIAFVPDQWSKTYFEWMRNIRDWCISRQLWWGHRIRWRDRPGYLGGQAALGFIHSRFSTLSADHAGSHRETGEALKTGLTSVAVLTFLGALGLILPGIFGFGSPVTPVTAAILSVLLLVSLFFRPQEPRKAKDFRQPGPFRLGSLCCLGALGAFPMIFDSWA